MKLALLCAAWIAGLIVGLELAPPILAVILFAMSGVLVAILVFKKRGLIWVLLSVVALLLAAWRGEAARGVGELLAPSEQTKIATLEGVIITDPDRVERGARFVMRSDRLISNRGNVETNEKVLVWAIAPASLSKDREPPYFRFGDRIRLTGQLTVPPILSDFDYREYLARQGIHTVASYPRVVLIESGQGNSVLSFVFSLRRKLNESLSQALPEPQASLASALLLGIRKGLPQDVEQAFRKTGTSHLLAISGLQVSILLGMTVAASAFLFGRRRNLYLLIPLALLWLYALVSGLSPPVERAAIMGSVYLAAIALGRPGSVLPALGLAAAIMAGITPAILSDVSFQLSFASMAGLALMSLPLTRFGEKLFPSLVQADGIAGVVGRGVVSGVAMSVAATAATLPLVAFHFHRIPTLGIPATVLALPVQPAILVGSAVTASAGLIHPVLGQVLGWLTWVPVTYMEWTVRLFSFVPSSTVSIPDFRALAVWAYYGLLSFALLVPRPKLRLPQAKFEIEGLPTVTSRGGLVALSVLALIASVVWLAAATAPDSKLHVYFLNVGQGDSILIVTPSGKQVLVDGGPGALDAVRAVGKRLPFWDRSLDMVVLTHPQQDHLGGLVEVVRRYRVGMVLQASAQTQSTLYTQWNQTLEKRRVPITTALKGQRIVLDKGLWLDVLHPPERTLEGTGSDLNNNSIVARLQFGHLSFLFPGDIEAFAESWLVDTDASLDIDVLKVPHHGSRTSTTEQFLSATSPTMAIISSGQNNPFGHPHEEVVSRLETQVEKERLFITARDGTVHLTTDGIRLWVRRKKG